MDNFVLSESDKCIFNLDHDFLDLLFGQLSLMILSNMAGQICVLTMLKHKIKVSGSLFWVYQLNYVLMLDYWKNINFDMNSLELLLRNVFQGYFLDRIFRLLVLFVSFIDDRIGTFADRFIEEIWTDFGVNCQMENL